MFNGSNRLLYGSPGSNLVPSTLTFHTSCCRRDISVSHALRLEKARGTALLCCKTSLPNSFHSIENPNAAAISQHTRIDLIRNNVILKTTRSTNPSRRLHVNERRRALHTSAPSSFNHTKHNAAPAPILPGRPPPLLPTQSSLPKRLSARPSLATPSLLSAKNGGPHKAAPPNDALPSSSIEERKRVQAKKEEERIRLEQEQKETIRLEAARAAARLQKKRAAEDEKIRLESRRLEQETARKDQIRRERKGKFQEAERLANLIQSFGWANKSRLGDYLRLQSLSERAQELQRRLNETYSDTGFSSETRQLAIELDYNSLALAGPAHLRSLIDDVPWLSNNLDFAESRSRGDKGSRSSDRTTYEAVYSPRTRMIMLKIFVCRVQVATTSNGLAELLHGLRHMRRVFSQASLCPELYSYQQYAAPVDYLVNEMYGGTQNITDYIKNLARRSDNSPSRSLRIWHAEKMQRCARQNSIEAQSLNFIGASGLQQELVAEFSLLIAHMAMWPPLKRSLDEYLDDIHPNPSPDEERRKLKRMKRNLMNDHQELWRIRDTLWLWKGVSKITSPDRARSVAMRKAPTDLKPSSIASLTIPSARSDSSHSAPWQHNEFLYPVSGRAIPIHYVTTYDGLYSIVRRFLGSPVLSIDTIPLPRGDSSRPVAFLSLANDAEIAVLHLGIIRPGALLKHVPFMDLITGPRILRVAFDVEAQARLLDDITGVRLENVLELRDEQTHTEVVSAGALEDGRGAVISSVAARVLNSPLPALDSQTTLQRFSKRMLNWKLGNKNVGSVESLQVINHLASRAYAVLQIYRMASAKLDSSVISTERPVLGPTSSLGPVLLWDTPPSHSPSSSNERMAFLKSQALALAEKAWPSTMSHKLWSTLTSRQKRSGLRLKALNRLTAYFLFTTYNESLELIQTHMDLPKVATEILGAVTDANGALGLRPEAAEELDFWKQSQREDYLQRINIDHDTQTKTKKGSPRSPVASAELPIVSKPSRGIVVRKCLRGVVRNTLSASVVRNTPSVPVVTRGSKKVKLPHDATAGKGSSKKGKAASASKKPRSKFADLSDPTAQKLPSPAAPATRAPSKYADLSASPLAHLPALSQSAVRAPQQKPAVVNKTMNAVTGSVKIGKDAQRDLFVGERMLQAAALIGLTEKEKERITKHGKTRKTRARLRDDIKSGSVRGIHPREGKETKRRGRTQRRADKDQVTAAAIAKKAPQNDVLDRDSLMAASRESVMDGKMNKDEAKSRDEAGEKAWWEE